MRSIGADLLVRAATIAIRNRDGGGEIAEGDMISAQRLERQIGIGDFVVGVGIEQLNGLVVEHFAQQRGDRLALGEPLAAEFRERPGRLGLVESNEARHPAKREVLMIERIQNSGAASGLEIRGW